MNSRMGCRNLWSKAGIALLICFAVIALQTNAQTNSVSINKKAPPQKKINIDSLLQEMRNAYYNGQYLKMDTIFNQYKASSSYLNVKKYDQSFYEIMIEQRLSDEYRENEANKLQDTLDNIVKPRPWSLGLSSGITVSKLGHPGWLEGIMFGYHHTPEDIIALGFDVGLFYQRMPFSFNLIQNKDNNNNYISSGYLLQTNGYSSLIDIPIYATLDIAMPENKGGVGVSAIIGIDLLHMHSTYVANYYHEYNYNETFDPANNSYTLTYSKTYNTNYQDNSFFEKRYSINLTYGYNIYWQFLHHYSFTFSPAYSYGLLKGPYSIKDVNYTQHPSFFVFRVTCSYLFNSLKMK